MASADRGEPRPALILRPLTAWADLRGSMRGLLAADPREGTLLALALASGLIWFLGRVAGLWASPGAAAMSEAALVGRVQAEFVAALFFRTLMLYGVAAVAGLVARAFGGTGSWKASRAATFWAALVAAPVLALAAALAGPLAAFEPVPVLARAVGGIAFAWAFAFCIAEAHGFRSGTAVLALVVALGLIFLIPAAVFA